MTGPEQQRFLRSVPLALLVALSVTPTCAHAQHQDYQAGPLPREGSAFTGLAQAPEANLFLGAATTSVPITVPP